jgi:hypothetical protein
MRRKTLEFFVIFNKKVRDPAANGVRLQINYRLQVK